MPESLSTAVHEQREELDDEGDDVDVSEDEAAAEDPMEMAYAGGVAVGASSTAAASPTAAEAPAGTVAVESRMAGPYGFGCTQGDAEPPPPTGLPARPPHATDEAFGDLIVHFSARECMRTLKGAPRAVAKLPALPSTLPSVVLVGPRPRPAPARSSGQGRAREQALREKLTASLLYHVLPHAKSRALSLGCDRAGPIVWLTIGGAPPPLAERLLTPRAREATSTDAEGAPPTSDGARGWRPLRYELETAAACVQLVRALAPDVAVQRLWLPGSCGQHAPSSLLDDDADALSRAPLVVVDLQLDAAFAAAASLPCDDDDDEEEEWDEWGRVERPAAAPPARAPPPSSTLDGHTLLPHACTYQVVWRPGVRVRSRPSLRAPAVGWRRAGTVVRTTHQCAGWVQIEAIAGAPNGQDGWMLADGDGLGFGRVITPMAPHATGHEWTCGRDADMLADLERVLRTWQGHPALRLLREEHVIRGLPLVATEDACALLGSGACGARLLPWRVRGMRGEENAIAATAAPPPPPADYEPPTSTYAPPKAYEAGANVFDLSKIISPAAYHGVAPPPPEPPRELAHVHAVCLRARKGARGIQAIGLPEDDVLIVSCGGRFEVPPDRCALLERRQVGLLRRIRATMQETYDEHAEFEANLARLRREHPAVDQYVDKRRSMLSVFTPKELKRWFESSGYNSPELRKTDERHAARRTRAEGLARLQYHLQRV